MIFKGSKRNESGVSLIELGVAMAAGSIMLIGVHKVMESMTSAASRADLAVQEKMAKMILREVTRSDGCNASVQNLAVATTTQGVQTVYSAALQSSTFKVGMGTSLREVSNMRFAPYTIASQQVLLDRCRYEVSPLIYLDCTSTPPQNSKLVFDARFRITLQKGSGLGAVSKVIEEVLPLYGTVENSVIKLTNCTYTPPAGATPPAGGMTADSFCNLLGPGLIGGTLVGGTRVGGTLVRPGMVGGKCDLKRILPAAIQAYNGQIRDPFQTQLLSLSLPTGCAGNFLVGFDRTAPGFTAVTGPYVCRNPATAPPACHAISPSCVRKFITFCDASPGGYDSGFSLGHATTGPFEPNSSCQIFQNQPYVWTAGVCGKHCN